MLALPLVKTRRGIPQRDISNVPTSVASSGKLKQQKLQNTIQNTHTKIKTVFIKTNSQNTHKKKGKKDLNMTKAIYLVYTNTPKKHNKKIIKDLNRTIRPGLGQKTKIKITKPKPKGSNPKNQK